MAKKISSSIFCRLIKLTRQKEDFFTESLAYALQQDKIFIRKFIQVIIGNSIPELHLDSAKIELHTQVSLPFSKIDMVFIVNDHINIAVENKLWSKEGDGQLKKYLDHDQIHYLAFITADSGHSIKPSVLKNENYLHPEHRNHFIWQDFLPVIHDFTLGCDVPFYLAELKSLCHYLGFLKSSKAVPTSAVKSVAILSEQESILSDDVVYDRRSVENIFTIQSPVQGRFQLILLATPGLINDLLSKYGWGDQGKSKKLIGNKHGQIYAYPVSNHKIFERLYVTPTKEGSSVRIRFTLTDDSLLEETRDTFEEELEMQDVVYEAVTSNQEKYLEFAVPLPDLSEDHSLALEEFAEVLGKFLAISKHSFNG